MLKFFRGQWRKIFAGSGAFVVVLAGLAGLIFDHQIIVLAALGGALALVVAGLWVVLHRVNAVLIDQKKVLPYVFGLRDALEISFRNELNDLHGKIVNLEDQLRAARSRAVEQSETLNSLVESSAEMINGEAALIELAQSQGEVARDCMNNLAVVLGELKTAVLVSGGSLDSVKMSLAKLGGDFQQSLKPLSRLQSHWDTEMNRQTVRLVQDTDALMHLHGFASGRNMAPLLGDWAMDPAGMKGLLDLVLARKPQLVVECGSGASTFWLATAFRQIGRGRVISLEHLHDYAEKSRAAIAEAGLEVWAEVIHAPLMTYNLGDRGFDWYQVDGLNLEDGAIDILLVDGPPESIGKKARYPALPLLRRYLAHDAIVLLDDCDRPGEIEIIEEWRRDHEGLVLRNRIGPRTAVMDFSKHSV